MIPNPIFPTHYSQFMARAHQYRVGRIDTQVDSRIKSDRHWRINKG